MAVKDRRDREKDQTREAIVDAARRLFAVEGYEAVSMRRIAQEIEYSPTAIYAYFKDKHDLFAAICRADFAALGGAFADLAAPGDPVDRIRKLGTAYCRFGMQHPNHYRLMFMTPVVFTHEQLGQMSKGDPAVDGWEMCRFCVSEAGKARRLRPEYRDVELAAQTFWAGVHGVVSLQIIKGADKWIDWTPPTKRIAAMVEALIAGICTPTPSGRGKS